MASTKNKKAYAAVVDAAIDHFRERGIILPTFAEQKDPERAPQVIRDRLPEVGLDDLHPLNLFRITWKNEPTMRGGLFGPVNSLELPTSLTGVRARIVLLLGRWFPTGAHKVGAAYGCLVPRIIGGRFDPLRHKAVWPSTGNYCRGGAFVSALMGCRAVAILPEEMSRERFEWLQAIGAEVIATPGCESNVKEIYDACWEIRRHKPDHVIFNQFDEFGNAAWHYGLTGPAIEDVFRKTATPGDELGAFVAATGSAGTLAAGDYLRTRFPLLKVVAAEARQCPTLFLNGFGGHRIEGIGDKHVPWIHNVRNTDLVAAIDDEDCLRLFRLFNEPEGRKFLRSEGVPEEILERLGLLGISGVANLLAAVKTAKYFEWGEKQILFTVATDSADLYRSRLAELSNEHGDYSQIQAGRDFERRLSGCSSDWLKELTFPEKRAIHNLKYFTWVEQQGKGKNDLDRLWNDIGFWQEAFAMPATWDDQIREFNDRTGLLKRL